MQYWQPSADVNVGDAMPFWDDGLYRLFYLIDRGHHSEFHGLGGHQWAQATTTDLKTWTHCPLAVSRGVPGSLDQYGICTGSIFKSKSGYEAWYATRTLDVDRCEDPARHVTERVCLSTSIDGVHFVKDSHNPHVSPAQGYNPGDFRDPFVFATPDGVYHLLVTARLAPGPIDSVGGCLAHYTSNDRRAWQLTDPFIIPGDRGAPECSDLFAWGDRWYLTFLLGGWVRYRYSSSPLGPWTRPGVDTIDGPGMVAAKTAAFGPDRRLAAGFMSPCANGHDGEYGAYAGLLVQREVWRTPDGLLATRFVDELMPQVDDPVPVRFTGLGGGAASATPDSVQVGSGGGLSMAAGEAPSDDFLLTATIRTQGAARFGVVVRGEGRGANGYNLEFAPPVGTVSLYRMDNPGIGWHDGGWQRLDAPHTLRLIVKGDVIDAEVDGRRCIGRRFPELHGRQIFLYSLDGATQFAQLAVRPLHVDK